MHAEVHVAVHVAVHLCLPPRRFDPGCCEKKARTARMSAMSLCDEAYCKWWDRARGPEAEHRLLQDVQHGRGEVSFAGR